MSTSAEEILTAALKLPHEERAQLAGKLVESLDESQEELSESEWEAVWLAECERRLEEVRAGRMTERPADEVFAEARARAKQSRRSR